jgi:hypothetical protein
MTNHLTLVIDLTSVVPSKPLCSKVAEISQLAVFPEQGVIFHEIDPSIRIVGGCASARRTDNLTLVVDPGRHSVGVAGICGECVDRSIFPDDWLKLGHRAGRVRVAHPVLGLADHFASIVDHVGAATAASQRRELGHYAVLPKKRQACSTGVRKPTRVEAAKVVTNPN